MKIKIALIVLLVSSCFSMAQEYIGTDDSIIMGRTEQVLINGIREMNTRKAATAYNIANVTTPGFKPVRFEDEIEEALRIYGDASILEEVNIDDEMVKTTKIRLKHQAYIRLLSTKMAITKRVVTLGKGG